MPLRRIQELLGHKSIVTTERYSHLGANGRRLYYSKLAQAVAAGFVTSGVVVVHTPQALIRQNLRYQSAEDFLTTRVTSTVREGVEFPGTS